MEQKKEKKYLIGSIVCGLLTVFGIAATVISLLSGSKGIWLITDCCYLILYAFIAYYAFAGYKKPHGNLLKYIMLFRTVPILVAVPALTEKGCTTIIIIFSVVLGLSCYIAGRLAKVKENLVLMIIVTAFIVAGIVSDIVTGIAPLGVVSPLVIWLDICVSYFLRYKQHREAGLADAPKK